MKEKVVWNARWWLRQELEGFMQERGKDLSLCMSLAEVQEEGRSRLSRSSGQIAEQTKAEEI